MGIVQMKGFTLKEKKYIRWAKSENAEPKNKKKPEPESKIAELKSEQIYLVVDW